MITEAGKDFFHLRIRPHPYHVLRVDIGQVLMSVRTKPEKTEAACEALRRAKFKFPGRQKIHVSENFGFTKFKKEDYEKYKEMGRMIPDGVTQKWLSSHGPLHRLIGK